MSPSLLQYTYIVPLSLLKNLVIASYSGYSLTISHLSTVTYAIKDI